MYTELDIYKKKVYILHVYTSVEYVNICCRYINLTVQILSFIQQIHIEPFP